MTHNMIKNFLLTQVKEQGIVDIIMKNKYGLEHRDNFQFTLDIISIWNDDDEDIESDSDCDNYYRNMYELENMTDDEREIYYNYVGIDSVLYEQYF